MLVITRKSNEQIVIDGKTTITILESGKDKVKLGIEAPQNIRIVRGEVLETENQNLEASHSPSQEVIQKLLNKGV